ncbi:hypothetical protein [Flagellimonas sp.]|uniref:hypothetical protein n=1 Tax=Flagellimonas sp. TaxID=2058762 RepID=UPI003BAC22FC
MNYLPSLKTLTPLLILIAFTNKAFTQSIQTEVEIIQEVFGLEKKLAVANFMNLKESADEFWTIYDEYETERQKLGKKRIQVISEYAQSYPNISEGKIEELLNRTQAVKKSFDKLLKIHFKKMKKEVGVKKAAQFWQIETYFSSLVQANIYSQIPFIGESTKGN